MLTSPKKISAWIEVLRYVSVVLAAIQITAIVTSGFRVAYGIKLARAPLHPYFMEHQRWNTYPTIYDLLITDSVQRYIANIACVSVKMLHLLLSYNATPKHLPYCHRSESSSRSSPTTSIRFDRGHLFSVWMVWSSGGLDFMRARERCRNFRCRMSSTLSPNGWVELQGNSFESCKCEGGFWVSDYITVSLWHWT